MRKLLGIVGCMLFLYSCGGGLGKSDVHYRDFGIDVSERAAPYLTPENHKDGWGKKDCLLCHQNFKHTMGTKLYPPEEYQKLIEDAVSKVGVNNAIRVCSACHGANGVTDFGGRDCLVCHDNMDLMHFYKGTSGRKYFHDFNDNGKIDNFDCVVCHWQPDMDGLVELDTDFARFNGVPVASVEQFCLECHSSNWNTLKEEALADTKGYGMADCRVEVDVQPKDIGDYRDFHGYEPFNVTQIEFKNISLQGQLLYYNPHSALACIVCHNPHASKNDALIVERVGETLTVEEEVKQEDNSASVKTVLIDPDSESDYEGIVYAKGKIYDLSNETSFLSYIQLPIENNSTDVIIERQTLSSLCAACHDGTESYSPVNGLGLPVDIDSEIGHNAGQKCSSCHVHGSTF
ncbi:doubled CXXCH domain-containing protein [Desulfurobacterium pacificum]|uniref:Doubled CXXCH domain-containing protein n=1 Tax=Desulfurobacterium pacificum TaxID=240166 RepID=A0ABY1NLX9_9BACT|nr:cytochrome c3 family protein [Desulfurobacterium pacificum]SMP12474.1 doubled CXXCH domain-containing protein [Desulfurobacterium pacificum]